MDINNPKYGTVFMVSGGQQDNTLNKAQIEEYVKCKDDPIYFITNYVYVRNPIHGYMLFDLHPYQDDMIELCDEEQFSIIRGTRQVGMTSTAWAYLLWYAIFKRDSTILITSDKHESSKMIMQDIQCAIELLPKWIYGGTSTWNKMSLEFDNGSRILTSAATVNTARGMSLSVLYCDNFAYIPERTQVEFWESVYPAIATNSKCIISSTRSSKYNLFDDIRKSAESRTSQFVAMDIPWYAPPNRGREFKKETIKMIGKDQWNLEYTFR